MLSTITDLDELDYWELMESVKIHPIFGYSTDENDEGSVRGLAVQVRILPDSSYLMPFNNLAELREIIHRMDNGELKKELRKMRREELDRRAVEEADGSLRLAPPSSYPAVDSPEWDRFDIESGVWS